MIWGAQGAIRYSVSPLASLLPPSIRSFRNMCYYYDFFKYINFYAHSKRYTIVDVLIECVPMNVNEKKVNKIRCKITDN